MHESGLKVGVVLLAAGKGSRMGDVPKCLLALDGVALIRRHLAAMTEAGIDDLVIVTGHYHEQIEPAISGLTARIIRNPEPEEGQQSSVRIGLEALGPGLDLAVVALADQPLVGSAELHELLAAFRRRPAGTQIVYPAVGGQRGNPVAFAGEIVAAMLASGAGRKFIDTHPELVHVYETGNEAFILDLDTREDLAALQKRAGVTLTLPPSVQS